jgi:hypothetical protein
LADISDTNPHFWIRRLREKIESDPDAPAYLHTTVRGIGYLFRAPASPELLPALQEKIAALEHRLATLESELVDLAEFVYTIPNASKSF